MGSLTSTLRIAVLSCGLAAWSSYASAQELPEARYQAGMTQVQYVSPEDGRTLNYMLIYPAVPEPGAKPVKLFLAENLELYQDAPFADGLKHPLVVFSHGAGGNGSGYAWFGQYLAERGYIVAMVYHYRANTFDTSALYMRNRLWQRPRDISLDITHLLEDKVWGRRIDPDRIGVAGHSQGGFTSLWIGGAAVDPELFAAYQRRWKGNIVVPQYLRDDMQIDGQPATNIRDPRVKAAFAMAPGDIQGFGMDEAGLKQMAIPAYIVVGAADTTTPPKDNAEFAAKYIPSAALDILAGEVGHEIFNNECDDIGRDNYPEACIDPPGVDRAKLHDHIGTAATRFFDAKLGVKRQPLN